MTVVTISSGPLRGVSLRMTERTLPARVRAARMRRRRLRRVADVTSPQATAELLGVEPPPSHPHE